MNLVVLNGSPKGETSVTMQYVAYMQKYHPEHQFNVYHVAQCIRKLEKDPQAFQEVIQAVAQSDGVLWAFPLYILAVHAGYKRFIELIFERDAGPVFKDKYAAALTTSIHFFDHTAINYIHAICDDLEMRYVASHPAEMRDLLTEKGQQQMRRFSDHWLEAIKRQRATGRTFAPVRHTPVAYMPAASQAPVSLGGKRLVLVTDAGPEDANLLAMIEQLRSAFVEPVETYNLRQIDIKGNCLGCLQCGYDYQCAYTGKDGYISFYKEKLMTADILVFAGSIHDRYLSSRWKNFFDRSFFNTHTPSLSGKQIGFLISGPLGQNTNLREILGAWVQFQHANLAGFVSDDYPSSGQIDGLIGSFAHDLSEFAASGYARPHDFLGVGGMKIFRDDIWGRLRPVFLADHRAYAQRGYYDFPQSDLRGRLTTGVMQMLLHTNWFRKEMFTRMKKHMVAPFQKVLQP